MHNKINWTFVFHSFVAARQLTRLHRAVLFSCVLETKFAQSACRNSEWCVIFLCIGNSSQVSDGAAAVLLAKRSKASQLGLPVLGVLRSYAVVGVPPDVMGIGPAYAIPLAVEKAGKN